jgi:predicted DNA-binding protein
MRLISLALKITPPQRERLRELSKRDGLSIAEHIRRAIDEYLNRLVPEA